MSGRTEGPHKGVTEVVALHHNLSCTAEEKSKAVGDREMDCGLAGKVKDDAGARGFLR